MNYQYFCIELIKDNEKIVKKLALITAAG